MTKLSDTQLVILGAAAQRADLSLLPLPDSLKLKGGALIKVMDALRNRGLIRVIGADGGPERVVITGEGMTAIGLESDDDAPTGAQVPDTAPTLADSDAPAVDAQAPTIEADGAATLPKTKPAKRKGKAKATKTAPVGIEPKAATGAAPTGKPTPRAGTKQALMIDMLKRPEGATVEQIAAATGWQHHTIRGAISGALKKKLGLTVEAIRIREVGPNKTGAKGSSTVYRIVS
jgi:Protein of unknown function (DUF3489)